jgi:predicted enzyme related to lactoylglutathione lyase
VENRAPARSFREGSKSDRGHRVTEMPGHRFCGRAALPFVRYKLKLGFPERDGQSRLVKNPETSMSSSHGAFVWHELMTTDMEAAKTFYGKVVGWTCKDAEMPGGAYWIFSAGDKMIAGLMTLPDDAKEMGAPPHWAGYVGVDDVDATAAKIKQLAGKIFREPDDIPNVGRFAVAADPFGATFCVFKGANPMPGDQPAPGMPGHVGWNELYSNDWEKAFDFYSSLFGWRKGDAIDMGPMGTYQLFNHGDRSIGGMMNKPPQIPAAHWKYYFNVPDIDAAVDRLTSSGSAVAHGPVEVPGGDWIAQAIDPQGVFFAVVGKKK